MHVHLLHAAAVFGCLAVWVSGFTGLMVWAADHGKAADDGR